MDPLCQPELSIPEPDFSERDFEQAGLLSGTELETGELALPRPASPAGQNSNRNSQELQPNVKTSNEKHQRSEQDLASPLSERDCVAGRLPSGSQSISGVEQIAEASKKQAANREHQRRFRQRQKVH